MSRIIFCFQLCIHTTCFVHISSILIKMLYPQEPSVRSYVKNLHDIDFPMTMRLCLEHRNLDGNDTNLKLWGYRNIRQYFMGASLWNTSIIGWSGHTENGYTLGSVEGDLIRERKKTDLSRLLHLHQES